jgi:fumarate reductase subunit D
MNKRQSDKDQQILEGKVFAILSYLSILCIIPLVLKKDNPFVLKHGKQGLILFLGQVAVFILHIILGLWILRLGTFVLGVMSFLGLIAVLQGRDAELPVVSRLANSITL